MDNESLGGEVKKDKQYEAISWKKRGNSLAKQGNFKSAISAYNKGLELDPINTDILHNKVFILNRLGRTEDAQKCQEQIKVLQNPIPIESKPPVETKQQIINDFPVPPIRNSIFIKNLKKFDIPLLCLFFFGLSLI